MRLSGIYWSENWSIWAMHANAATITGKPLLFWQKENLTSFWRMFRSPGANGHAILKEALRVSPNIAVILLTSVVDIEMAVDSLKEGAYDYITKPFSIEEVSISVSRALEKRRLLLENQNYQRTLEERVASRTTPAAGSAWSARTHLPFHSGCPEQSAGQPGCRLRRSFASRHRVCDAACPATRHERIGNKNDRTGESCSTISARSASRMHCSASRAH